MGVFDWQNPQRTAQSAVDSKLMDGLIETLAKVPGGAGLKTLEEEFRRHDLDAKLQSWMGNNIAQPLSSEQLLCVVAADNHVLTPKAIDDLRSRCGLSKAQTIEHIAHLMPTLVRALTPRGELPSETVVQIGLESLRRELSR